MKTGIGHSHDSAQDNSLEIVHDKINGIINNDRCYEKTTCS